MDELAEESYRRLMVCHQRLGGRAEALQAYERCRQALAVGLGVAPSLETEALRRTLLGSAPAM